jgi:hypothetical protein
MQEVAVKVKLTAAVCVRAPNAIVARVGRQHLSDRMS